MGIAGPKPTELKILKLRGSRQVYKRKNELDLPSEIPKPPTWLPFKAMKIWGELLPKIIKAGVPLSPLDSEGLGRLCLQIFEWGLVIKSLEKNGLTYTTKNKAGHLLRRERPEVKIMSELNKSITMLGRYYGLNPSARTGLRLSPPNGGSDNKKNKFFNNR
jgi:P27 family predicted phage terminase small subunit